MSLIVGDKMGLINLDQPDKVITKRARLDKYDVGEIQFSLGKETLCAIASGSKVRFENK